MDWTSWLKGLAFDGLAAYSNPEETLLATSCAPKKALLRCCFLFAAEPDSGPNVHFLELLIASICGMFTSSDVAGSPNSGLFSLPSVFFGLSGIAMVKPFFVISERGVLDCPEYFSSGLLSSLFSSETMPALVPNAYCRVTSISVQEKSGAFSSVNLINN